MEILRLLVGYALVGRYHHHHQVQSWDSWLVLVGIYFVLVYVCNVGIILRYRKSFMQNSKMYVGID